MAVEYDLPMEQANGRRAALEDRRRLAALRRARAEQATAFRRVSPLLCAAGVRFAKLPPARIARDWGALFAGPGADEELDLSGMSAARLDAWDTREARDALVRAALAQVAPADPAALVWHPSRAGLRLPVQALVAHLRPLLDEGAGDTVWIVTGGWLVQVGWWSRTVARARY